MDYTIVKKLYYSLIKIRKFEEKIIELYSKEEMRCPVHLYIGQEAIAVGVCAHLKKEDYLFSYHRNHGHLIAKGVDIKPMFAELYGKKNGCSGGKGGSPHMISVEHGVFGTTAIVGGGIPIAVGGALSCKMKKEERIAVLFFGDGAVDEGTFYESMNFAKIKNVPLLCVCENNFYATNSPQKVRQANPDIYKIADLYGMPAVCVDGNDVFKVYAAAKDFIGRIRKGEGPCFIEARTYRCRTHVGPETDIEKGFRAREEVEEWMNKCPYKQFKARILENNLIKEKDVQEIEKQVDKEIEEAVQFAASGPFPDKDDLDKDVY